MSERYMHQLLSAIRYWSNRRQQFTQAVNKVAKQQFSQNGHAKIDPKDLV